MAVRMSSIQFMANYQRSLNRAYQKQQTLFEQADGSSIHRASDDPVAYSKFMRYQFSENENDQYQKNVDTAVSWMKSSDGIISNMSDNMKTFVTKTVAAANTYNSDSDFQSIGKEMMSIIQEVVSNGNAQQGDRYLFAGQKDTTQPFLLSTEEHERGLAKTLDAKQAAFFKDAKGDVNATLYQMLTLEDTDGNTYYLDTQSGYIYDKAFVDEGYKELIADGYTSITDVDRSATDTTIAETKAIGEVGMTVDAAWEVVNEELTKGGENLKAIISGTASADEFRGLYDALSVIASRDADTIAENITTAEENLKSGVSVIDASQDVTWQYYTDGDTLETRTVTADDWTDGIAQATLLKDVEKAFDIFVSDPSVSKSDLDYKISTNILGSATTNLTLDGSGLSDLIGAKLVSLAAGSCKEYDAFQVKYAFTNQGVIRTGSNALAADEIGSTGTFSYTLNSDGNYDLSGLKVTLKDGSGDTFKFTTVSQQIVTYSGDDNHISMVKLNGATDRNSDIVNLTGQDMYGCDIFDDENSGNDKSGAAMVNNMLTVYTKVNACDEHWLSSDGVTLSNVANSTLTVSQTTLGSRLQLYTNVADMLDNQSTVITEDITNVSGTDVAQLATKLMELTTLYNMSLALGGRVLPQSLADYI